MSLAEDIINAQGERVKIPKEWQPYSEQVGQIGSAVVHLPRPGATERDLVIGAGFDPDEWRIVEGRVKTRKWMGYDQRWLYWYAFDVEQGESPESVELHVEELAKFIRRRRPAPKIVAPGDDGWVFNASDWQIGKKEGDDGTPQTVDRVLEAIDLAKLEIRNIRRAGFAIPTGVLAGVGDIGEGTCGFYPNQPFLIDANRRQQNKITRELLTHAIDELGPFFDLFKIKTVGGNHGENRDDGKKVTDDGDNDDVAQFEAVREAYDRAAAYGGPANLEWQIPEDELSISDVIGGVHLGWTHGHLFRKGSTVQAKAADWWRGQDFGFQEVRGTKILVSAHFHHFSAVSYGSRTHLQTPPMDPGSRWFRNTSGEETPAGVLSFRVSASEPLGFSHLQILGRQHR